MQVRGLDQLVLLVMEARRVVGVEPDRGHHVVVPSRQLDRGARGRGVGADADDRRHAGGDEDPGMP